MRTKDILLADKTIVDWGQWRQQKMPVGAFPLSKSPKRSYRLGAAYRWRITRFEAIGHSFRLLVAYRTDVEEFRSLLGMDVDGDTRIIAEVSYHGSHPGWHAHSDCGDLTTAPIGVQRWPGMRRYPGGRHRHRNTNFTIVGSKMTDEQALEIAVRRYRLKPPAGDLFARRR